MLSIVGFGGILVTKETTSESARMVAKAIDRGINYFDVAPTYGNAEEMLGPALEPYRNDVFLACKTTKRSAVEAEEELQNSLKLLRTDHFDLYQMHSVTTGDDVDQIFAAGGALETFVKAREKGLVRYLGFSAHSEEAAALMMDRFEFDSILFPLNWVNWNRGEFGSSTVEKATEKGLAILALKTMARQKWIDGERPESAKTWYEPVQSYEEAERAVRFTFSLPITAGPCPGNEYLFDWMCDAADKFSPLSEAETADVAQRSREFDPIFSRFETRWEPVTAK
jgi:aryl-alcohol dehydrogenase-like predicted oxidoreductase